MSNTGIQYTPVDSMATLVMPHLPSQSAMRSKSSVKVSKLRTGCASRSAGTATYTFVAPTSRPAALGSICPTMGRVRDAPLLVFRFILPLFCAPFGQVANQGNLPNGIAAVANNVAFYHDHKPGARLGYGLQKYQCVSGLLPKAAPFHLKTTSTRPPVHCFHDLAEGEVIGLGMTKRRGL